MTLVHIEQVGFRIGGRTLLADVSLEARAGEVVAIVGPNGAGKTTLLRVLSGDITPSAGRATIDGHDTAATTLDRLARLRAYLGPAGVVDTPFTVRDVVMMGRHPHRHTQLDPVEHDQIVEAAMERTDVAHLARRPIASLSTGERQRVGLARVLAQQTPVLLLDEPTSALDIGHQEAVMRLLSETAASGTAVLAVLHDLNLAAAHADRVVLLDTGRMRSSGPAAAVLQDATLSDVYRQPMRVIPHPERDCPLVLTVDASGDNPAG